MASQDTRERLLDAGEALMLERGYRGAGLGEILERSGVPKGSFYHHFGSKEGFALAVIDRFAERLQRAMDSHLEGEGESPLAQLRAFFESSRSGFLDQAWCHGCLLGNLGQEMAAASDALRQRVEQHLTLMEQRIASSLEAACERGELRSERSPSELATALLHGWYGALLRMKTQQSSDALDSFLAQHFSSP